jgi:O-antigen/teichoic acid export membrane protein
MFAFSKWVILESVLAWMISWGDAVALGHYMGPEVLGYYRMGGVIVAYLSNIFFTPIVPVAFGLLSRLQDDRSAFTDSFGKLTRLIVMGALPIGVGIALTGQLATESVLGPTWAGAGLVVQLMGFRMGLEWLVGLNSTAFSARGRPDMNVKILILAAVVALPAYVWAAPYGLLIFCLARLLSSQLNNIVAYQFACRILQLPQGFLWSRVRLPLMACVIMVSGVSVLKWIHPAGSIAWMALMVLVGSSLYISALWCIDRTYLMWGIDSMKQVFDRKNFSSN